MPVPLSPLIPSVSLLHPLPWAPPHQSSYFLPSPSHPTTQQVEHWLPRASLWPCSPCSMRGVACPGSAASRRTAARTPPQGLACLGCLAGSPYLPVALSCSPASLPSLLLWLYSSFCFARGLHCLGRWGRFPPAPLLLPRQTWCVHGSCSSAQASVESSDSWLACRLGTTEDSRGALCMLRM